VAVRHRHELVGDGLRVCGGSDGAGVFELRALAVLLRLELAGNPLAGVDAQPGALVMLAVEAVSLLSVLVSVLGDPVVRAVIRDVDDFVRQRLGTLVFGYRVVVGELFMSLKPNEKSMPTRRPILFAEDVDGLAFGNRSQQTGRDLVVVVGRTAAGMLGGLVSHSCFSDR
jgi:hypothetical protein